MLTPHTIDRLSPLPELPMSLVGTDQQHNTENPRWSPPLPGTELKRLLDRMREWSPLVLDEVFDDLKMAQSSHAGTDPVELEQTAERLRRTLIHLVHIGRSTPPDRLPVGIAHAVENAATLTEPFPVGCKRTLVQRLTVRARPGGTHRELSRLRRLSWMTEELVEQMSEARLIRNDP